MTVANVAIAVSAIVGGLLVDSVSASSPLLVGGVAALLGGWCW